MGQIVSAFMGQVTGIILFPDQYSDSSCSDFKVVDFTNPATHFSSDKGSRLSTDYLSLFYY